MDILGVHFQRGHTLPVGAQDPIALERCLYCIPGIQKGQVGEIGRSTKAQT